MGGIVNTVGGLLGFSGPNSQTGAVKKKYWDDPYLGQNTDLLNQERQRVQDQQAFLANQTGIDNSQADQTRGQQQGLIQNYQDQISGQAPSIAQQQLFQGQQNNMKNALALSASGRGRVNPGLAQRNLLNSNAAGMADTNAQAALLRAQEQQAAQQGLSGLLGNMRGQDMSQSQNQATLNQQIEFANQAARQQQRQMAEQQSGNYIQNLLTARQNQFAANQHLGGVLTGAQQADNAARGQFMGGMLNQAGPLIGQIGSGIGSLFSDARAKEGISKTTKIKKFLDSIDAKEFKYKNPNADGAAPGKRFGVMAQDLEKSEVGKSLVKDTPQGKMIDGPQAIGALMAAVSELNKRTKKRTVH